MPYDRGLADRVRSILARTASFTEREMFGGLAFLVNGNMCCGIVKTDLMVRLSPDAVADALKRPHVRPMDFTGKPMKSMIYVDVIGTDDEEGLEEWVRAASGFAKGLPPKAPGSPARPRRTGASGAGKR